MHQNVHFQTVANGREIVFRESLVNVVFSGVLYGIGYYFFFLAIANLLFVRPLPLIAFLASLAWIAIIVGPMVSGCRRIGARQHLGNVLGNFIRNRFAEFTSADFGESTLCFGYKYGSNRHYFLKLRAKGIKSVDWGPGQCNIPGKDNDWHVALRFDVASVLFDGGRRIWGIFIVGPSGPKAGQEAVGSSFIEFLKANHVPLNLPPSGLLGLVAEVVEPLHPPLWRIRIGTDEHVARPIGRRIEKGSKVVIEEIRGTSIYVRQILDPAFPRKER
jgi:hypothetical protein